MNMTTLDTAAHITITAEDVPQHIVGMTWSMRGREVIANSSPEANWGEYIEVKNQDDLNKWKKESGKPPLKYKGQVFVLILDRLFPIATLTNLANDFKKEQND